MKLISKTLIYYLLVSLPLLVIAGLLSYFLINSELKDGIDETLMNEKVNAEKLIQSLNEPKSLYLSYDSLESLVPCNECKLKSGFVDTTIYNSVEKENVGARMLRSYYTHKQNTYQITLIKTTMEEEELLEGILATFALIVSFLILSFVMVNWLLSKTLWKPFYSTLSELNKYEIQNHEQHQFNTVNTLEFNQLNLALNKLMGKIYSDYQEQKEFTENASHEMQTPLAVIKANLSLLMQSNNLKEDEMNRLQTIENTIKKLSAINKALILLSKIENHQFHEDESISINHLIKKITDNYLDLFQSKNIHLELNLVGDCLVKMNSTLAEILLTNLIQNAIRHNTENGKIIIELKDNKLIISNSGAPLTVPKEQLFMRFKKNDASKDSLGLGLSIVKGITKTYGFEITYNYSSLLHNFQVTFN